MILYEGFTIAPAPRQGKEAFPVDRHATVTGSRNGDGLPSGQQVAATSRTSRHRAAVLGGCGPGRHRRLPTTTIHVVINNVPGPYI